MTASLSVKATARFQVFTPALMRILNGVYRVTKSCPDVATVVITSVNDSGHAPNSQHYRNAALDLRTKNFPTEAAKLRFAAALRRELGTQFTVLYEGAGTPNEHLHVQQRKGTTYAGEVA